MPKKKAPKTDSREFAQAMARAIINRDKFHNLPKLKPGQARWQHERAIEASIEFEDAADDATWVEFWTRENVETDIEAGDVEGVFGWLSSKIWWIDFKKRQKDAKRKAKKADRS